MIHINNIHVQLSNIDNRYWSLESYKDRSIMKALI